MSIELAKTAGFCFGVEKAVNVVYNLLNENNKVTTLGEIIHNQQLIDDLTNKGVKIVEEVSETEKDNVLVVRAHGVPKKTMDEIHELGLNYVDATCPFVSKIHRLVSEHSKLGKIVLIAGDYNHPEIIGIVGHCETQTYVFKNEKELQNLLNNNSNFCANDVIVCAQTTFNVTIWEKCLEILKKLCTNALIFGTICNATIDRQKEAENLAKNKDVMIVIGGHKSSNTAKLFDVCKKYADTYLVETAKELPKLQGNFNIGITAGASTPASIIKEVLVTMTEMNENQEMTFEELLEENLKSLNTDEKVVGIVQSITPNEVYVDVGRKQAGFIPVSELSSDPNVKAEDIVKIGDEIELLIMKTNDQEGTIMLSKKRIDAQKGWVDLQEAMDASTVLTGKVTEIIKGGLIIAYNGVRVFVPASQATMNRTDDIEALKGTEQEFKLIEVNRQRRRAVGSIRVILREKTKEVREKFWEQLEEGQEYTGTVKSLTSFGAFVDIGGVDGMVHITELSWGRIKHPSEVVAVGDTLTVTVKSLDKENKRISLGYKKSEDNPWEIMKKDYPVDTVCEVTIVSMTSFGAFARIIPGIDGLVHISQIADKRIEKPQDVLKVNEKVMAKITEIDFDQKRVSLSIRALLEDSADEATEEVSETEEA